MEEFRTIEGHEKYSISNLGRVMNNKTGRFLKPSDNGRGYLHVAWRHDKKKKFFTIHRLIANAFIPKIEGKDYVDHIDNDKKNNSLENLRWCSQQENNFNRSSSSHNTSGIKGVNFVKPSNKWEARMEVNSSRIL